MFHRTLVFVSFAVHVLFVYFMQFKGMCETCHCIPIFNHSYHFNLILMKSWIVHFKFRKTMLFKSRNYNSYQPTNCQMCSPRFNLHTSFVAQVLKIQLINSINFPLTTSTMHGAFFNQIITWHVCVVLHINSL
jgi:hypothetical protein